MISLGDGATPPMILNTEEEKKLAIERDFTTIEVPEEFRRDFEVDIDAAIRDLAGRPTLTVRPFIRYRGKILEAIDRGTEFGLKHPFSRVETTLQDGGVFIVENLRLPTLAKEIENCEDKAEGEVNGFRASEVSLDLSTVTCHIRE